MEQDEPGGGPRAPLTYAMYDTLIAFVAMGCPHQCGDDHTCPWFRRLRELSIPIPRRINRELSA